MNGSIQTYRPDIDGLRAVAVLSVLIFHLKESILPGGYVGVDVFFVISGYLISLHIFSDIEKNSFSIKEFYRRRIRRIAPPMLLVVFLTVFVAQLITLPEDSLHTAKSGLWSSLSGANIYFWLFQDTSYFAAESNQLPLLHTWSLGVEEQFYIIWPLILILFYNRKKLKLLFLPLLCIAIATFVLSEIHFADAPSFIYYMLPSRSGELLIGAITAQIILRKYKLKIPKLISSLLGIIGLILVISPMFFLSKDSTFPGIYAIPPTIGAAIIILSGNYSKTMIFYFLKWTPINYIGRLSYSAYLWHFPIIAFYVYGNNKVTLLSGSIITVITFFLSFISYKLIEQPTRTSKAPFHYVFIRYYAIPTSIIIALSIFISVTDGYGIRHFSDKYRTNLKLSRSETPPAYQFDYVCQRVLLSEKDINNSKCIVGNQISSRPRTLLWGDSNAAHFVGMIGAFAKVINTNFRNLEHSSCPPLLSDPDPYIKDKHLKNCLASLEIAKKEVQKYDSIIISAAWLFYFDKDDKFFNDFEETIIKLVKMNKNILIIGTIPYIPFDRKCNEKSLSYPFANCKGIRKKLDNRFIYINNKLKSISQDYKNTEYFDINYYLCPNNYCSVYSKDKQLLYFNSAHISMPASWKIGYDIIEISGVPKAFANILTH